MGEWSRLGDRIGRQLFGGGTVPVPEGEAELLRAWIKEMIDRLDAQITGRDGKKYNQLERWHAPNRITWDDDYGYSQLDLAAVIDDLQELKGEVEATVQSIREHNEAVLAEGTGDA